MIIWYSVVSLGETQTSLLVEEKPAGFEVHSYVNKEESLMPISNESFRQKV